MTKALDDVIAERKRQIHDRRHGNGCCCIRCTRHSKSMSQDIWRWSGWAKTWFRPKNQRRDLVRSAALIIAEIERLDRADKNEGAA